MSSRAWSGVSDVQFLPCAPHPRSGMSGQDPARGLGIKQQASRIGGAGPDRRWAWGAARKWVVLSAGCRI